MKYEDELKKMSQQMGGGNTFQGNNLGNNISKSISIWVVSAAVLMLGIGAGTYFLIQGVTSYIETEVEQTTPFSGDPSMFDPVNAYEEVHAHAGIDTQLTKIDATMVKSDGTLDLTAQYTPAPHVNFTFYRILDEPPENAPPTGTSEWYQKIQIEAYEPGQTRHVRSFGGDVNMEYWYTNKGLDRDESTPNSYNRSDKFVDPPNCHFSDLWITAIKKGASAEYLADISYDKDGYEFDIRDTQIRLKFDHNCQLVKYSRRSNSSTNSNRNIVQYD